MNAFCAITAADTLPPVDLVVNCFERTYRAVLAPGFIAKVEDSCRYRFARRVVLINNIEDLAEARRMADERIHSGEIDDYYLVSEMLDAALKATGLKRQKLGLLPFYSNWALVALIVPGSNYMVHYDAEIAMQEPVNWIEPSLRLMRADPRVATAAPMWLREDGSKCFREKSGEFNLGYGFSDQIFLLDRREFARPIYCHWTIASMRYPVSHISPYFEQWVDAYLRVSRRYRATFMGARYIHPMEEGAAYPHSLAKRLHYLSIRVMVRVGRMIPGRHRFLHA